MRAIASLLLAWLSIGAVGAEISGHIDLTSDGKSLRPEEAQDAVVYFRPKQPPKIKPAAKPYVMYLRDLGSANGTFVNGVQVRNAVLHPDDQIAFDQNRFLLEAPGMLVPAKTD